MRTSLKKRSESNLHLSGGPQRLPLKPIMKSKITRDWKLFPGIPQARVHSLTPSSFKASKAKACKSQRSDPAFDPTCAQGPRNQARIYHVLTDLVVPQGSPFKSNFGYPQLLPFRPPARNRGQKKDFGVWRDTPCPLAFLQSISAIATIISNSELRHLFSRRPLFHLRSARRAHSERKAAGESAASCRQLVLLRWPQHLSGVRGRSMSAHVSSPQRRSDVSGRVNDPHTKKRRELEGAEWHISSCFLCCAKDGRNPQVMASEQAVTHSRHLQVLPLFWAAYTLPTPPPNMARTGVGQVAVGFLALHPISLSHSSYLGHQFPRHETKTFESNCGNRMPLVSLYKPKTDTRSEDALSNSQGKASRSIPATMIHRPIAKGKPSHVSKYNMRVVFFKGSP